jgi:predicted small secreted protein
MKKYIILSVVLAAFVIGGCSNYMDINQNPNTPVSATPELVLTNALNVTAARLSHNEIGEFWGGQWAPSGSVSGFNPEKTYDITTSFRTTIWTGPYDNLVDYEYIRKEALKVGKQATAGIALVMKAYNYQQLVDAYNSVPYTDALKGTVVIQPKYDDGKVVYDSLFLVLDKAVAYLSAPIDATNASPGTSDIIFAGNTAKWIKFAKTLRLRMLIRISGVNPTFVATEMAKAGFTGSSANFLGAGEDVKSTPGYLKTSGKMNPFYENYGYTAADAAAGNHDFYTYSKFFIDILKNTFDPRIARLAYPPTAGGSYTGVPYGEGNDTYIYTKVSGFGPAFIPQAGTVTASTLYSRPQVLMTAAESFFLQAEAVQRGLLVSDKTAQVLYETGITESFKLLGVDSDGAGPGTATTDAVTYYSQAIDNVGYAASTNKLTAIRTQKWIALASFNGFEAWTEYRRTGVPAVPPSTKTLFGTKQPKRLLYPLSEYSSNTANVNAQGTISQMDSKIFWMP